MTTITLYITHISQPLQQQTLDLPAKVCGSDLKKQLIAMGFDLSLYVLSRFGEKLQDNDPIHNHDLIALTASLSANANQLRLQRQLLARQRQRSSS